MFICRLLTTEARLSPLDYARKMEPSTNSSLPKFTPIFLILPQTLVVCQNWLASNLEKDILHKCQKCRRIEDPDTDRGVSKIDMEGSGVTQRRNYFQRIKLSNEIFQASQAFHVCYVWFADLAT